MQNHRFLDTGPQLSVSRLQKLFGFFFFFYALAVSVSASSIQPKKNTENCQYLGKYFKKFRVEAEPVVLKSPFPKLGNRVLFSLHYNLSWHKNDSEKTVLGTHRSGRTRTKDNALWILPATPEDSGTYICTFRNESYCATMSVELKVFKKSEASLQSLSYQQVLITSGAGYLVCPDIDDFIQDKNDMEIKWYKDAVLLDQSNKTFSILKGSVYCHINNVSLDSSGYYTCELPFVYEGVKYNITRHINPRIIKKKEETMPVIIGSNKTVLTSLGSKLIIPCKAFFGLGSRPTALLRWTANNTFLHHVYKEGRVKEGQLHEYSENNRIYMEMSLIFNSVEKKDLNTEFICTAQNRLGYQTLQVRVKEEPTFSWGIAVAPLSLIFLVFVGIWMHIRWKQKPGKVYTTTKSKIIARDCQSSTPYRKEMI
ncbi:interleukin-1 receptor type 2 isoform X2 [Phascolarctos cinereus]|uniref:Interleukin-1 receptor type 2 isoform X2 n=1 Tax=Phascolarctos cinereus TaxID=38626 RepID=A0A6P5KEV9_PHACI|nr:interleukin-1 receptor type 2 isoform X2 [Phascolarctos cinereus]